MPNGRYLSNIYMSGVESGEFGTAKLINATISSKEDIEEVVGLNSTGDRAIIYKEIYPKGSAIYECNIIEKRVESLKKLPKTINSKCN